MKFLQRCLGPYIPPETTVVARFDERIDGDENPKGLSASAEDPFDGQSAVILTRVVLADGTTLADRLAKERIREMNDWIRAEGPDPIPRALLRLLADLADRGESLTDQKGIVLFWQPGRPPKHTWDGPATLAQIAGVRIRLLFHPSEEEGYKVVEFNPKET